MKQTRKILLISLFVAFLFLRIFTSSNYNFLDGDHVRYLIMTENFPYHTTVNNQIDLNHGPMFSYAIYFFNLVFQQDYLAAIFLSLLSGAITLYILYRLFMLLTGNFYITFIVMVLFTLSVEFVLASKVGLKESFAVMVLVIPIYYYTKGVKFNNLKSIIAASIFGGIAALTVDQVIFLFPTFVLSYFFFNHKKPNIIKLHFPLLKYALLPIIVTFLFYSAWTGLKAYEYSINEYYPTADGNPVRTEGFGLMELLNPRYFSDYSAIIPAGFSTRIRDYAYGLGYMFNIVPFVIPRGLNFTSMNYLLFPRHIVYMVVIYLPLALFALYGFVSALKGFIRTRKIYNNVSLYMLLVFLIFLFPLTQIQSSLRYFYIAFIFMFYFIAYGSFAFLEKLKVPQNSRKNKAYILVAAALLLLLIPYWYYNNSNFLYFNPKFVYAQNTADFLNQNIDKGETIMVQPGYNYQLQYLTGMRAVVFPPYAEDLFKFIDYYNASYIIFGKFITWEKYYYSRDSVDYILTHPEQFKPITTIDEDYDSIKVKLEMDAKMRPSDQVYIYKVIRPKQENVTYGNFFVV